MNQSKRTFNLYFPVGSLGFIIYVDIPNCAPDLSFILYTDDTSAFTTHKDVKTLNDVISNGLDKLNTWFL